MGPLVIVAHASGTGRGPVAAVTGLEQPPFPLTMAIQHPGVRHDARGGPSGSDTLDVRERYLRRRRRLDDHGWITLWVTIFAVMGWLLVAGLTGLGH